MRTRPLLVPVAAFAASLLAACTGLIGGDGGDDAVVEPPPDAASVPPSGLRRLTVAEYDNTVADLLGDTGRPAATYFPEDARLPFDNDYASQTPSSAFVDGAEALSIHLTTRLMQEPARRDAVVGCAPTGPDDVVCLEHFVRTFGRRALRRPLADDEVDELLDLQRYAQQTGDFYIAVETILWTLLQDPELLYRVEIGSATAEDASIVRLDSYEVVTRLSFLLWGSTPDDTLLDAAERAESERRPLSSDALRDLAASMLQDERARAQVRRFHAMWLGYETLPHEPALAQDMQRETAALFDRIVFDETRPWRDLLLLDETFLTAELATHYGLPAPSSADGDWVSLTGTDRKGLLSQGTFLSNGGSAEDTSPTMRGLTVLTRLLCQPKPEPPPNVNIDDPPEGTGPCKWDQRSALRQPGCINCHGQMDPVGWGLEHYDRQGRYREFDDAGCAIEEHSLGEIPGLGTFRGPAQLADTLLESDQLRACVAKQVLRFAVGRSELSDADTALADRWLGTASDAFLFQELLLELITSPSFLYRKLEG